MPTPEGIWKTMQAGKLLERTCPTGDVHDPVYRLDGLPVPREAVETLEARGLIRTESPRLVIVYGYTTYKPVLCSFGEPDA